ncbi:MAG: DNA repair protein RecN [Flavobacteriia bacterium]|nr:DNA repair protein RecN [Flavobacteriia bacterium]OIP45406.1 MAG: DNA repair protein RecN [Flavobacteriaceae bacterium CG2_30_31_66]PIV96054.1 MAG: DNA repair protein RecN [Flavobacteriaceae bacterium CG17_big_fil_post_rev_8_21_14_2_50_31_13]PIX11082.1 MAG: DNA repair protein RecN [Flavobacteriaceae bacterium CG_4_8_14_3_um_filter_31_8]PIY13966.1 MAG: DNA repair protein RecN [Flavobacteriaceae bacterium CG_4_10_14_3_um_filter_31_253]PIZ11008.1 MAG: DNA repair protein RecN [Flavobacteriaceae
MLTHLSINNYALINELTIDFFSGLSIITGETGAGKSILLGALGLVLGNRADLSSLKDTSKKCVVEAKLSIANYDLENVFEELELDYDDFTIIRREILPSGKSRAFVNDTPVNLSALNDLKSLLIDVHSQHQTMQLSDADFQFSVIDALAKNGSIIATYKQGLQSLSKLKKELEKLEKNQQEAIKQYEYNLFLFNELEKAKLQIDEQQELEEKLDKLNNIEEIKLNLSEALAISVNEEIGIQSLLLILENRLSKIAPFSKEYQELSARITSIKIELDDIVVELEDANEHVEFDPIEAIQINDRLQLIYNLQKKHAVNSNPELLIVLEGLSEKVSQVENADENIKQKKKEIETVALELDVIASKISDARKKIIPNLQNELQVLLSDLGMVNARFSIKITPTKNYFSNGKDDLEFLFSANKGGNFGELKKVASGGELSRIMLSIKKILSENTQLPTIIFDEIDTGVSGEVSNKIAAIMQQMSKNMQVITITHLPQIAAKGSHHYKVFKEEINGETTTQLKKLTTEERVAEIAEMLSGKALSESAIIHAKELLN